VSFIPSETRTRCSWLEQIVHPSARSQTHLVPRLLNSPPNRARMLSRRQIDPSSSLSSSSPLPRRPRRILIESHTRCALPSATADLRGERRALVGDGGGVCHDGSEEGRVWSRRTLERGGDEGCWGRGGGETGETVLFDEGGTGADVVGGVGTPSDGLGGVFGDSADAVADETSMERVVLISSRLRKEGKKGMKRGKLAFLRV
jgi:hypothetical protein